MPVNHRFIRLPVAPAPCKGAALLGAALVTLVSQPLGAAMEPAAAPATSPAAIEEQRIDDSAQQAVAVTIYNDDLALVKDLRRVALSQGENRLAWRNVSQQIRPETALLAASSGGLGITLLEQNFDFDLLTPESLLKKYVGRTVQVIRSNDAGERTVEEARVLAASNGTVLRYADRIETGVVGHLSFPDVPADLRDLPTLVLHLASSSAGEGDLELSYLTGGMGWKADYVANLSADGAGMDLNGWVTLTNSSGVAYRQAQVQLVAGEVNRVEEPLPAPMMSRGMVMAEAAPMPSEEALYEYHLYTLPRPTDIQNNQTNGSLGVPLPAGVVRVYSKDSRGNAQFVGEDAIEHTPRNETVALKLGESFDVTARRKQTSFRKLSGTSAYDYAYEAGFELELKNAKPEPVEVKVLETLPADWRMVSESQPHTKESASLASWRIEVPADGSASLTWLVQVRR
ncbi:MAG: hypothetical protein H6R22_968 [Chromatiaceae bacterium]|nr:hypothetical protein [Chromatiaceae bacterium]